MTSVTVRRLEGRTLLGEARQHRVITDRRGEDGGTDKGCTSGELLLLSIGSCATGSLRNFLQSRGIACPDLSVGVAFVPSGTGGGRDAIEIDLDLPHGVPDGLLPEIEEAAQSGGVVSRIRLGSELRIRCRPRQTA